MKALLLLCNEILTRAACLRGVQSVAVQLAEQGRDAGKDANEPDENYEKPSQIDGEPVLCVNRVLDNNGPFEGHYQHCHDTDQRGAHCDETQTLAYKMVLQDPGRLGQAAVDDRGPLDAVEHVAEGQVDRYNVGRILPERWSAE